MNGSLVHPSGVVGVTVYVRVAGEFVEFNNSDSAIIVSSVPEVPPVIAVSYTHLTLTTIGYV